MRDATPDQLRHHREPAITVSMQDEQIVIHPNARLDREATVVLNAVLNAAVIAGTMAVLDLDGGLRPSTTISAVARRGVDDGAPAQEQRNEVVVAGLGCIGSAPRDRGGRSTSRGVASPAAPRRLIRGASTPVRGPACAGCGCPARRWRSSRPTTA
ncbi:MAG: hypothetical protein WKF58_03840 [Ilumatobacteraceae bacterium]